MTRDILNFFGPMKLPFQQQRGVARTLRQPARSSPPIMSSMDVGALYRGARTGGDFFDFVSGGPSRMLLLLLDIAGQREEAMNIAAAAQDTFRGAADLMLSDDVNEPVALTHLLLDLNKAIMTAAEGVRCAPAFLACYNESLGTLCYINAGHTPALVREGNNIIALEANGLPLGLFSHAMHDAQMFALPQGSALLLVSRGLVEARAGREEFGLDRVKQVFLSAPSGAAQDLCLALLDSVRAFLESKPKKSFLGRNAQPITDDGPLGNNDVTTLALVRAAAARVAIA